MICKEEILLSSCVINQSCAMLFNIGDHDSPSNSSPRRFQCLSLFLLWATLLILPTSFHAVFPCCTFLQSFQLSQDVLVSLLSLHGQKRLLGIYVFYLRVILLCGLLVTLFHLVSLQSMRFIVFFSKGPTFLLPPNSIVLVLKLSWSRIYILEWVE